MAFNFPFGNRWAMLSQEKKVQWTVMYVFGLLLLFIAFFLWISTAFAAPRYTRYFCFAPDSYQREVDSVFQPIAVRGLVREKVHLPYVRGSRVPEAFFLRLVRLEDSVWRLGGAVDQRFDFSGDADIRMFLSQEIYDQVAVGDTFQKLAGDYTYLLLSRGGDSLLAEPSFHYQCRCRQRNYSHDRKDGKLCCWGTP